MYKKKPFTIMMRPNDEPIAGQELSTGYYNNNIKSFGCRQLFNLLISLSFLPNVYLASQHFAFRISHFDAQSLYSIVCLFIIPFRLVLTLVSHKYHRYQAIVHRPQI